MYHIYAFTEFHISPPIAMPSVLQFLVHANVRTVFFLKTLRYQTICGGDGKI